MTLTPPAPLAPNLRALWRLRPDVTFLNHGSFGALPAAVADVADDWRRRVEAEPIELLGRRWRGLVDEAKRPVARFLNAEPEQLGFVTNATDGVNAVLRSLPFVPGDELLTTTHVYHAVRQAMTFVARQTGATYREVDVPLPVASADAVADTVVGAISDRTRLLVVDHVTSPTGLVFPVKAIARACAGRGVELLVDGAHAPGMLPLDLTALGSLGVTYYAGNLHKWCCAPKGTAFLWVGPDRSADVHPTVVSHWYGDGLAAEFHWQGTRDPGGWLSAPAAIDFLGRLGWDRVRAHNRAMAAWAHATLCDRFGVAPISPPDNSLLGSMATVRLPPPLDRMTDAEQAALQQSLYTDHKVEVPLFHWGGHRLLRVSCQVYNTPADYERLEEVIAGVAKG